MLPRIVFSTIVLAVAAALVFGVVRLFISQQPLPQATAALARHDPRAAQLILRPLVRVEPRNAEAHILLARTQIDLYDPVAAEKELRIARALRYERVVITPLMARALMMQERYADLLAEIPPSAPGDEERAMNLALRAGAYAMMADIPQAQSSLDAAMALAPRSPAVLLAVARLQAARSDLPAALAATDASIAAGVADVDVLLVKADIQLRLHQPDAALATLADAIARDPTSVPARIARARIYIDRDDDAKARTDVDAAIEVNWHDIPLALQNAMLMMRAGRVAEATTFLQGMQAQFEKYPRGYYVLAIALSRQDRFESALEMLSRFQRQVARDRDGLRMQGMLEQRVGRPASAVETLRRLLEIDPTDPLAFDLLGRAYFTLGQTAEALDAYRAATTLDPANKDFAAHLAAAQTSFGIAATPAAAPTPDATPAPTPGARPAIR